MLTFTHREKSVTIKKNETKKRMNTFMHSFPLPPSLPKRKKEVQGKREVRVRIGAWVSVSGEEGGVFAGFREKEHQKSCCASKNGSSVALSSCFALDSLPSEKY